METHVTGSLREVLEATEFLVDGHPSHGVSISRHFRNGTRWRSFQPDGMWEGQSSVRTYFKSFQSVPNPRDISNWHREIWNEGKAPLFWAISNDRVDLYNGFKRPVQSTDISSIRINSYAFSDLDRLNTFAGHIAMETGNFWRSASQVNREESVDVQLLADLGILEGILTNLGMETAEAQAVIARSIFCQYLVDRKIIDPIRLNEICGYRSLSTALRDGNAASKLFAWLRETFNGDIFLPSQGTHSDISGLDHVASFLDGTDLESSQLRLFPYQFDILPVELLSSIYERFAHSSLAVSEGLDPRKEGIYYTRMPLVSFVLDQSLDGLSGRETVLDLTCGSGVFLVEAFRRLVGMQSQGSTPSRDLIRSTLYRQVYGVDKNEAAIRIAAFSLYLAALELDPDPSPVEALRFEPLIGRTLHIANALDLNRLPNHEGMSGKSMSQNEFDVIVGNPPWSYRGKSRTNESRSSLADVSSDTLRNPSFRFVLKAIDLASATARFGLVLGANPFFAASKSGRDASLRVIEKLLPVTLVNLSSHSEWLFQGARMPAIALFSGPSSSLPSGPNEIAVVQVPWSPAGMRSHGFDVSPDDVIQLPFDLVKQRPNFLKAASCGRRRDLVVLDRLTEIFEPLGSYLRRMKAPLRQGMIRGNQSRDSRYALGWPLITAQILRRFSVPDKLPKFDSTTMERPRDPSAFRGPLLLVKEFIRRDGRPVAAIRSDDTVFRDSIYGASFPKDRIENAKIISAILNSSMASWYLFLTSSTFGLWMRRVLVADILQMPLPPLFRIEESESGRRVLESFDALSVDDKSKENWHRLDNGVMDLYGLRQAERLVVRDGLTRATWQWSSARNESTRPARIDIELRNYADAFMGVVDPWLAAEDGRTIRSEMFQFQVSSPLQMVRFVIDRGSEYPRCSIVHRPDFATTMKEIERSLGFRFPDFVPGALPIRVYGEREVVIIKGVDRRNWIEILALEDADTVIRESMTGDQ